MLAGQDRMQYLRPRGAVWTQTTDVEGEVNGLFTYDRAVLKLDAQRLARRNRKLFEIAARAIG